MSVYDVYFGPMHVETENFFGVPLCRSFAMTGIQKMLEFKEAYSTQYEKQLKEYKQARIFHLWDYHFMVAESKSGYRYLTITNERIKPHFVDVVQLGSGRIDLRQIVGIAQDLYHSLKNEGKSFDYKAYFRNVFIPQTQMKTEMVLNKKLRSLRAGNEKTMNVCYNYNGEHVFFWISEAFYQPPVIECWITNRMAHRELNRFNEWYKFESLETKFRKVAVEIADVVLL